MPVTYVNSTSIAEVGGGTTLAITPGTGADYTIGFSDLQGTAAFTATFNGDTMSLLSSRIDSPDGIAGRASRVHGRVGDYTGASRDYVVSDAARWRHVATFDGVDQTTPTIGSPSVALSTSVTVLAADNPTGSRVVWCASFGFVPSAPTVNVGAVHEAPAQFGETYTALGSVAGTGADLTITLTGPTVCLLQAITLREASGGGPTATPALGRWRTIR